VTYTFRALPEEWRLFNILLTLKEDTPMEFFTRAMRKALEENKELVNIAIQAVKSTTPASDAS
jgi:hypothetical protein